MKKQNHETVAVVSQNFTTDFVRYYEWAGCDTKKFTGHFADIESAIESIPQRYRIIKVDVADRDGKPVSYTMDRDAPCAQNKIESL